MGLIPLKGFQIKIFSYEVLQQVFPNLHVHVYKYDRIISIEITIITVYIIILFTE